MVDFIAQHIPEKEFRPSAINWLNTVKAVQDGYGAQRGLAHGVQKDAIQNAWDARSSRRQKRVLGRDDRRVKLG